MKEQIKTADQLHEWLFDVSQDTNPERRKQRLRSGCYVATKIRKEIMTSECQAQITLKGRIQTIGFQNAGGGVYRAYVVEF